MSDDHLEKGDESGTEPMAASEPPGQLANEARASEAPAENAKADKFTYMRAVSGHERIGQPNEGLRAFLSKIRDRASKTALAEYLAHVYDDRLFPAGERYRKERQEDVAEFERKVNRAEQLSSIAENQAELLDKRREEVKSRLESQQSSASQADARLRETEHSAAESLSGVFHTLVPDDKHPESDRRRELQKRRHEARRLRKKAFNLWKWARAWANLSLLLRGQKKKAAETARGAEAHDEAARATALEAEIVEQSSQVSPGRHGPYEVVAHNQVVVSSEEAAAALGVPYYTGPEVTDEDVRDIAANYNSSDPGHEIKLNSLSLSFHAQNDRRFMSPIMTGRRLRWISAWVGLVMGISLCIALDLIRPEDIGKALSPGNLVSGVIDSLLDILRAFGWNRPPLDHLEHSKILLFGSFIGWAIATVSRHTVIAAFIRVGEESAIARFKPDSPSRTHVTRLAVSSAIGLGTLGLLLVAEVNLERAAFQRLINHEIVTNARSSFAPDPSELVSPTGRTVPVTENERVVLEDDEMRRVAALCAGLLILSGYLMYAAFEGYIRGRDTVLQSMVKNKRAEMTEERLRTNGITPEKIAAAIKSLSLCAIERAHANLEHKEVMEIRADIEFLDAEIAKLRTEAVSAAPLRVETSAATMRAYYDWCGAQHEFQRVLDACLRFDYKSLDELVDAIRRAEHELDRATRELDRAEKLKEAELSRTLDRNAKQHERDEKARDLQAAASLEDLKFTGEEYRMLRKRANECLQKLYQYVERAIEAGISGLRGSSPGWFHANVRNLFSPGSGPPKDLDPDFVQARMREIKDILKELKSILDGWDTTSQRGRPTPDEIKENTGVA